MYVFQVQKMSLWRHIVDKQKVGHANATGDGVCTVAKSKAALLGPEDSVKTCLSPSKQPTKESLFQHTADFTTGETTFFIHFTQNVINAINGLAGLNPPSLSRENKQTG